MTTPTPTVPPPGAELDEMVWTLLGYPKPPNPDPDGPVDTPFPWHCAGFYNDEPIWNVASISTDWSAAMRALELWREQELGRAWRCISPQEAPRCKQSGSVVLWRNGIVVSEQHAPTIPRAVALALRAALGAGK